MAVYDYLKNKLELEDSQMIVVGRSIGSGPATLLGAEKPDLGQLVLITPFTTLKDIANSKIRGLGWFVLNYFDNLSGIKKVRAPTFMVHGLRDEVIPYAQSQKLMANKLHGTVDLKSPPGMYHNHGMNEKLDLLEPVAKSLEKQHEHLSEKEKTELLQRYAARLRNWREKL